MTINVGAAGNPGINPSDTQDRTTRANHHLHQYHMQLLEFILPLPATGLIFILSFKKVEV